MDDLCLHADSDDVRHSYEKYTKAVFHILVSTTSGIPFISIVSARLDTTLGK